MATELAYGPDAVITEEAEVGWVRISDIRYDYLRWDGPTQVGYQRPLDERRVKAIVEAYSPALVKPALVNIRSDGSIYNIDGHHGIEAERRRGRAVVRAIILRGLTPAQEADIFWRVNTQRTAPHSTNVFGARVTGGDWRARRVFEIAAECGYRAGSLSGGLFDLPASGALENVFSYPDGERLLRLVLTTISAVWPADKAARQGVFVEGLGQFAWTWDRSFGNTKGNYIDWARFHEKLAQKSAGMVVRQVAELKALSGGAANAAAYAAVLRDIYNGRRDFRGALGGQPKRPSRTASGVVAKASPISRRRG